MTRRAPSGAAVLQPGITAAITDAVLAELVERGYARLSMEGVAKRAGAGKSALYRRWRTKQEMVLAVLAEISVPRVEVVDTGTLRGDLHALVTSVAAWLTEPPFSRIIPDLVAEITRAPDLAEAIAASIGAPRRALARKVLERAVARGELAPDTDLEMAQDLPAALVYWRMVVRRAPVEPDYLDRVTDTVLRALGAASG
ncbi:TetR/AcrR family transcriptional regulator [Saccharothrix coeruleofusca]|uniref:TetR family transcriptional regulator n=1 Tax=Saccharothrix coeruleofusca TaxID=33919 RepID=A0A918ALQ3_9PSEU|nr:TetR/AcrR family transcriptional regulator [Saccharothrix coeruleofusca]MBP2336176.1 AcrR family transcriptional regulator [Saccharothrix coeruleofusca]GGP54873.1 TetR family transcriptional regulator [Saccharothrix coeruleofusca]